MHAMRWLVAEVANEFRGREDWDAIAVASLAVAAVLSPLLAPAITGLSK